ncbi:MAG: aspartate--tRNA(Asn) ligase [Candidatus Bathyarchaeia archaeon]
MVLDELGDWRRSHYSSEINPALDGSDVTIFGWVEDIRDLGRIKFLTLRDREGLIQITVKEGGAPPQVLSKLRLIGRQYAIGVKGKVRAIKEAPRGVEVEPSEIKILGTAKYPLPIDPTGRVAAEIDVRLDNRVLDLRRPIPSAIFKIRHVVIGEIRNFLAEEGFLEVHTPKIISSATEGGAALFAVEFFKRKAYLAQSPELYKEQLSSVFEKVFEIGTYFRAEESHTRRHLNEFVSVDVEEAFVSMEDVMDVQERLILRVADRVTKSCKVELELLGVKAPAPRTPFRRYSYDEILEELRGLGFNLDWGEDIPTPAYRELGRLHRGEYYFITNWPTRTKPFYIKPIPHDPDRSHSFDLMYEWIEISSGGARVDDKDLLIRRLIEQGLDPSNFQHFLRAFDFGMPPHAGFGMGLDRLMMVLTGMENIREVVLFPRDRFRLEP